MSPLEADSPPMYASRVKALLLAAMPIPRVKYSGVVVAPRRRPAHKISGTARLINSSSKGRPQLALTSARGLRFSVKAMWYMCGMTMADAKNTSSRVRHGPSCKGACRDAKAL